MSKNRTLLRGILNWQDHHHVQAVKLHETMSAVPTDGEKHRVSSAGGCHRQIMVIMHSIKRMQPGVQPAGRHRSQLNYKRPPPGMQRRPEMRGFLTGVPMILILARSTRETVCHAGFNVEDGCHPQQTTRFTVWDVAGRARACHLWRHFFASTQVATAMARLSFFKDVCFVLVSAHCTCLGDQARFRETKGLVFVVDGSDRKCIRKARNELHRALDEVSSAC